MLFNIDEHGYEEILLRFSIRTKMNMNIPDLAIQNTTIRPISIPTTHSRPISIPTTHSRSIIIPTTHSRRISIEVTHSRFIKLDIINQTKLEIVEETKDEEGHERISEPEEVKEPEEIKDSEEFAEVLWGEYDEQKDDKEGDHGEVIEKEIGDPTSEDEIHDDKPIRQQQNTQQNEVKLFENIPHHKVRTFKHPQ
jgi:hypothetical protein